MKKLRRWWHIATYRSTNPLNRCEVCNATHVVRHGKWDHCPRGHIYVGERSES